MPDPYATWETTLGYLARYPGERERLRPLLNFLENNPPESYANRENPIGHLTCSGFLASESGDSLLLIYHLKLQRFLQPGGHVEGDPTLLAAALREIREEVGLAGDGVVLCQPDELPIDIDPHRIPARGSMPEHWHFDFRFLFRVTDQTAATVHHQIEEVSRPGWFSWDSAEILRILPSQVIVRLQKTLEKPSPIDG